MTAKNLEFNSATLVRSTSLVAAITVISRVFGFIRDLVIARGFGAGMAADAFFVAFRIPNLLRSFVAEGALTAAFVPVFSGELRRGKHNAQTALNEITGLVLLITVILSILGIIFAPEITMLFAPGFGVGTDKMELCILLTRIMMPFVICISIVAMANGALNTLKIYGSAALAQVIMNIALIGGGLLALHFDQRTGVIILAGAVLLGGVLQILVQFPPLRRVELKLRPVLCFNSSAVKDLIRIVIPALAGAGIYQLSIFMTTVLASLLPAGSISWLFYADRLAQIPIGIYSIALASVLLPTLANMHHQKDKRQFSQTLCDSLRYTSFFILPIAAALWILADPLVIVLFERGEFSPNSSRMTAMALRAMAIGIWGVSCHSMMVRGFLAKKDTITPTIISAGSLTLTLILALLFMGPPQASTGTLYTMIIELQQQLSKITPLRAMGHAGLATASSISYTCAFIMLLLLFVYRDGFSLKRFATSTGRSAAASAVMVMAIGWLTAVMQSPTALLIVGIPTGAAIYIIAAYLLKSEELQESVHAIRRKMI